MSELSISTYEEGTLSLLEEVGVATDHANSALRFLGSVSSRYARDMKLNLKAVLKSAHLTEKETALLGLLSAVTQQVFN